jgi:Spy/CpxP family protein refolding chaperone
MNVRMITTRLLIPAVGLLAALNASAMPPAPPDGQTGPPAPMGMPMPGEFDPIPPYLRRVQLTDAQKDKVLEIMHRVAPTLRSKEREARRAQQELRDLALSDAYDNAKARHLADTSARTKAGVILVLADADNQIYRLLTAEQRTQIANKPQRENKHCFDMPSKGPRR